MKLDQAKILAEKWVAILSEHCERIEIAGGVRRGKAEPHDIEIVCIPKMTEERDMFGYVVSDKNALSLTIDSLAYGGMFNKVKDGERFKQLALPEGINIDLFIVRPETWAVQYTIRTGPSEFSHWFVTPRKYGGALPSDCKVSDGQVWRNGQPLAFAEEIDFLEFLGLGWIEPGQRRANMPLKVNA